MQNLCLRLCFSACLAFFLFIGACSSPSQQAVKRPTQGPAPIVKQEGERGIDVIDTKRLLQTQPLDIDTLMQHAQTYIQSQRYAEAQALLIALAPYLPEPYHAKAKVLITMSATLSGTQALVNNAWLNEQLIEPELETLRHKLLIENLKINGKLLDAMALDASLSENRVETHHSIYLYLGQFSNSALQKIEQQYPSLRPHVALIQLVRKSALQPDKLRQALEQFQRVYYTHPLVSPLPNGLKGPINTQTNTQQNVLVLLPLSGRFQSTGHAIKQGILAAYFDENQTPSSTISFADTETLSDEQILEKTAKADWVIGPLLKETIDKLLPKMPTNTPKLVLNRADISEFETIGVQTERDGLVFFGLAPEDEAEQIAEHVAANGFTRPIVVASNLGSSNRMLSAFIAKWNGLKGVEFNNKPVDVVTFDDIDSLDESLSSALGVAQSESNASQIDRMTNRILFDQTRSRQDIDAIIVFASPEEMALINPMVEASISPFRQQTVPVFATSRSIETSATKNTLRDLENVHFLDSPLILQANQWPEISQSTDALWPQQSVRFKRFFAFGYDAYTLLPQLPLMSSLLPYQYFGLSGVLQMNAQHQIRRRLPMAQIKQQNISLVEE